VTVTTLLNKTGNAFALAFLAKKNPALRGEGVLNKASSAHGPFLKGSIGFCWARALRQKPPKGYKHDFVSDCF